MERSFADEVKTLRIGAGETFYGEGVLAVTKGLLQSGVSYVGGYQGAPISHLVDVLLSAKEYMDELGIHVEACTNEASAAAMLGASINYPLRGAVNWKSIVGTNVASDALSNLSSVGVKGGVLIVIGEDYGEGAAVIQERSYAFALKSTIVLFDPKPDLSTIVDMTEHSFALSEASHAPTMIQLRIRACHVQGEFIAKDNIAPKVGTKSKLPTPAKVDYSTLAHPPVTFIQEKDKLANRIPAAQKYILENNLNEIVRGSMEGIGFILQGGLYNTIFRQLGDAGLADSFGGSKIDLLILNVTYPLVPAQVLEFCSGKEKVLIFEEGSPDFIEQQIVQILVKGESNTNVVGKEVLPAAGEYTGEIVARGLADFFQKYTDFEEVIQRSNSLFEEIKQAQVKGSQFFKFALPPRPPGFCTGCPERPIFGAIKLAEKELGKVHYAADIGCHSFASFPPFSFANSILGYGLSLASSAAVEPFQERRVLSVMGDGGFWHNGLLSGVVSALQNGGDRILLIMQNGYTSATGQQYIPSSQQINKNISIQKTLESLSVKWMRTIDTHSVEEMVSTLKEAMTTPEKGLKIIIADGECMLAAQRRIKREYATRKKQAKRVELKQFGVDEKICTGDKACIRLSGCPSLTIKDNPDPLKDDPLTTIDNSCVGCGYCGEISHAASLCPSFYQVKKISYPGFLERLLFRFRQGVINTFSART